MEVCSIFTLFYNLHAYVYIATLGMCDTGAYAEQRFIGGGVRISVLASAAAATA